MFNNGVLANDLHTEHFDETLSHFVPGGHCADVVEHGRRLGKADALLDLHDEADAAEVHVVLFIAEGAVLVDALWQVLLRPNQLTRAKREREVLVIVEAPNTVAACRLQVVSQLQFAHEDKVLLENLVDGCAQVALVVDSQLEETEQEGHKIELVARAIVDALIRSERFFPVDFDFRDRSFKAGTSRELSQTRVRGSDHFVHPGAIGPVSKPHWLFDRGHFIDPHRQGFQQIVKRREVLLSVKASSTNRHSPRHTYLGDRSLGHSRRLASCHECGDEAHEVGAPWRFLEGLDVLHRDDSLFRSVKLVRVHIKA